MRRNEVCFPLFQRKFLETHRFWRAPGVLDAGGGLPPQVVGVARRGLLGLGRPAAGRMLGCANVCICERARESTLVAESLESRMKT